MILGFVTFLQAKVDRKDCGGGRNVQKTGNFVQKHKITCFLNKNTYKIVTL